MFSLASTGTQQMYLRVGPWTFAAMATFSDITAVGTTIACSTGCPDDVEFVHGVPWADGVLGNKTVGLLASVLQAAR